MARVINSDNNVWPLSEHTATRVEEGAARQEAARAGSDAARQAAGAYVEELTAGQEDLIRPESSPEVSLDGIIAGIAAEKAVSPLPSDGIAYMKSRAGINAQREEHRQTLLNAEPEDAFHEILNDDSISDEEADALLDEIELPDPDDETVQDFEPPAAEPEVNPHENEMPEGDWYSAA